MEFATVPGANAYHTAIATAGKPDRIVVCGGPDEQEYLEEQLEGSEQTPEQIVAAALKIDPVQWFQGQRKEYEQDSEQNIAELLGEWPGQVNKQTLTLDKKILSGKVYPAVTTASLHVAHGWEVLAHFKYGNWNACPEAVVHCAVWKHWQQKYDAHVVGVSHDTVEAVVRNPPRDQAAALALAQEQFLYCNDIVDQGVETISNLAAILLDGEFWFFWWD